MPNYLSLQAFLIQNMIHTEGFRFCSYKERPWWLRAAFAVLSFFTRQNYENYYQGIGKTIYLGKNWDQISYKSRYYLLIHEREHLYQFKRYSFPLMAFLYLFFPFPIGLAYFRFKFEREAMRAVYRQKRYMGELIDLNLEKNHYFGTFCGPNYLFPWPFKRFLLKKFEEDVL